MPRKGGKSTSPKKKEKMATGGVGGGEHEHDNSSHESKEDIRRSVRDGGASDKGLIPNGIIDEIFDSLSHVMSKIESVYESGGSPTYTERSLELTAKVQDI